MLGVVMMSVVKLNVIMLSEAASLEHFDRNFENKKNAEVENCQKNSITSTAADYPVR
jgi:hypothetical protein